MKKIQKLLKNLVFASGEGAPAAGDSLAVDTRRYLSTAFYALLPCALLSFYYFQGRFILTFLAALLGFALTEAVYCKVGKRLLGGGALVYALLFALVTPPSTPAWMTLLGAAFGALFGKEIFGGTGRTPFSAVALGRVFLAFAYPAALSGPYFGSMLEASTKNGWVDVSVLMLLGAFFLFLRRRSNGWLLLGLFVGGFLTAFSISSKSYLPAASISKIFVGDGLIFSLPLLPKELAKVMSSMLAMWHWDGLLFAIAFLAVEPSTGPRPRFARLFTGALVGFLAVFMRTFTTHGAGVFAAILMGNAAGPLIERLASPLDARWPGKQGVAP